MTKISKFEDIIAWQKARNLVKSIYSETIGWKDYGLRDQIQRASVTLMRDVAEGFERQTNKELRNYLSIAKASCAEVRSILEVASDVELISKECYKKLNEETIINCETTIRINQDSIMHTYFTTFNFTNFMNFTN